MIAHNKRSNLYLKKSANNGRILKIKDLRWTLSAYHINRQECWKFLKLLQKMGIVQLLKKPGYIKICSPIFWRIFPNKNSQTAPTEKLNKPHKLY